MKDIVLRVVQVGGRDDHVQSGCNMLQYREDCETFIEEILVLGKLFVRIAATQLMPATHPNGTLRRALGADTLLPFLLDFTVGRDVP